MHGAAILEDRKHLDNEFLEIIKNLEKIYNYFNSRFACLYS